MGMTAPRPPRGSRLKFAPPTRIVTREQFDKGHYVYANGKVMHVGYFKIAQYNDGRILVEEPVWREM
jgi:hypothetical protein